MTKKHVNLGFLEPTRTFLGLKLVAAIPVEICHKYFQKVSPEGHEVISVEEDMYIFSVGVSSWAIPAIWTSQVSDLKS
jgi:hypothetical protein